MTEETLGRRIAAHRKRLGLTQDSLAEQLGVTAQAVSKWENDQSCPDISMLPKLSEVFSITIDELLGVERQTKVRETSIPSEPEESVPVRRKMPGRKEGIGIALWLLLTGGILLAVELFPLHLFYVPFWTLLGLTGLTVFGLFGLYPRFSMFRLGCALFGGYYLYCAVFCPRVQLNEELLLPILLVFFGLSLLVDSVRGKQGNRVHLSVNGAGKNIFEYRKNTFVCSTFFGDDHRTISLPVLEGGEGSVCFGDLVIDLHDCVAFSEDCRIGLQCIFGSMTLYVPRNVQVQCINKTAFGTVQEYGSPGPDAAHVILVENDADFGEISIRYL